MQKQKYREKRKKKESDPFRAYLSTGYRLPTSLVKELGWGGADVEGWLRVESEDTMHVTELVWNALGLLKVLVSIRNSVSYG